MSFYTNNIIWYKNSNLNLKNIKILICDRNDREATKYSNIWNTHKHTFVQSSCYYEIDHESTRNIFFDCFIQMSDSRSLLHRAIRHECPLTRPNSCTMLHRSVTHHHKHVDNVDNRERLALSRNVRHKLSVSGIPRGRSFYRSTKCLSIAVPFPNIMRNRAWKYLHAHRCTRQYLYVRQLRAHLSMAGYRWRMRRRNASRPRVSEENRHPRGYYC